MVYYIYVLKSCSVQKSYVGMTNNLDRRLAEHNSGKHFYTKRHKPWVMIYHEQYDNLTEARKREKQLKTANGRKFLKTLFLQ
ncbi:MAG: GIY-YIG nuclease family protein [Candidatus Zambryskibacteria bacterium]|nr:GIY-YIG nuclease family protein [Candidatus Zambryskibacteria bacterium]